jgi:hypothetical protein
MSFPRYTESINVPYSMDAGLVESTGLLALARQWCNK